MASAPLRAALGRFGLAWFVFLGVGGCQGTTPLESAGVSLKVPDSWQPADPFRWNVPGTPLAAWSGPEGSSLVVYQTLPDPGATAGSLAEGLANRLANLPELTVSVRRVETLAGQPASRVEVICARHRRLSRPQRSGNARGDRRQTARLHSSDHHRLSQVEGFVVPFLAYPGARPWPARAGDRCHASEPQPPGRRLAINVALLNRITFSSRNLACRTHPRCQGACSCPRPSPPPATEPGAFYKPAIGSRLRPLLWTILVGFALLAANGFYLSSVTALTWYLGTTQQTYFYMMMVALHLAVGLFLVIPFLLFGFAHLATSWRRPNKGAIRYGLILLAAGLITLISGFVLVRIGGFEVRDPRIRNIGYWFHVAAPFLAVAFYVRHRLAGPRIRWHWARRFAMPVAAFVAVMGLLHFQDPRSFGNKGPREGKEYFYPSEAVTANGKFIPPRTLMMDQYCLECHKDAYNGWFHSAHHFSSFNNKAYLSSVRETRKVMLAARWVDPGGPLGAPAVTTRFRSSR